MKTWRVELLRGWGKTAVLALMGIAVLCVPLGQSTSYADQVSTPVTQLELLQWLVHLRGAESSLPAKATVSDYIQWALSQKIEPKGGWNPSAVLTPADFAQTLSQLFGLNVQGKDAVRALELEGVVIPQGETVTRTTLVSTVDQFGFQSPSGRLVQDPTTKTKGNNGVGNGLDPQPPGNPKVNDGPGTGPGNPGNKPPHP